MKILLGTNETFTIASWKNALGIELIDRYNIVFANYKELHDGLSDAEICFSIDRIDFAKTANIKLLYIGVSDIDFFDKTRIRNSTEFYTSKGIASQLIAEHVLLQILALTRRFPVVINNQRKRKWEQTSFFINGVKTIKDYNIGILGLGNNGRVIANNLNVLGCTLSGCSPCKEEAKFVKNWYNISEMDVFLHKTEILIVAVPLRKETKGMISKQALSKMSESSFLINISRGDIIDENDLYIALKRKEIKGASLDVFSCEPLPRKSKLWKLDNLIITPHIAGNINLLSSLIQKDFVKRLKNFLSVNHTF